MLVQRQGRAAGSAGARGEGLDRVVVGGDDGDLAVVDTSRSASVGDFVVARVDDQFTLKELVIERGRRALKAHNPAYPLILPDGELDIVGVVVGLTRKIAR
mgnify:CR=1 FL=1